VITVFHETILLAISVGSMESQACCFCIVIAGIAVLLAAGFFGYMLALLQRRVGGIVSSKDVSLQNTILAFFFF